MKKIYNILLTDNERSSLKKIAKRNGFRTTSAFIRSIVLRDVDRTVVEFTVQEKNEVTKKAKKAGFKAVEEYMKWCSLKAKIRPPLVPALDKPLEDLLPNNVTVTELKGGDIEIKTVSEDTK